MTTRPVPPVVPGASPGLRRSGGPGAGRPVPLATPPGRPDVVYGFGRIDVSGRVADRVTIAALGWRGGDRLTVTAEAGVMIARRDPGGMVTVPSRPYVVIPAALRRRCGLRAGDHVLLAAWPGQDTLAAYSFAVVDQALRMVTVHAGDLVLLDTRAANHDPAVFPGPDRFDIAREGPAHLSFGHGAHYCLGAPLARIELQAVFSQLLARFPAMRLAVPLEQLRVRSGSVTGGLTKLPVQW
jgi:hypothetical protein